MPTVSVKHLKIQTSSLPFMQRRSRKPQFKVRALEDSDTGEDLVGVTAFLGPDVGAGVFVPTSGQQTTRKAVSWLTSSIRKRMNWCGVVLCQTRSTELASLRS